MRWKNKKIDYIEGAIRIRKPWAWLPTKVGDTTVWLEQYIVTERLTAVATVEENHFIDSQLVWIEVDRELAVYYC